MKIDKKKVKQIKAQLEKNGNQLIQINVLCENTSGFNNGDVLVEFVQFNGDVLSDCIGNIYD